MSDRFYNYSAFDDKRVEDIFKGWDGLGGYHGLLIRKVSRLLVGTTALDVGCGLCHLYECLKVENPLFGGTYVGTDIDDRILGMARERYPQLNLLKQDVYDLNIGEKFDTVYGIGLYSGEPEILRGINNMLNHANHAVVLTYFAKERNKVPSILKIDGWEIEFIIHNIDEKLEIVRMWKTG